jgi:hypothetical protein
LDKDCQAADLFPRRIKKLNFERAGIFYRFPSLFRVLHDRLCLNLQQDAWFAG